MFTKKTAAIGAVLAAIGLLVFLGIAGAAPRITAVGVTQTAATCTTDSSGYCTVSHSLGAVPDSVLLTPIIAQGAQAYTLSAVASTFTATTVKVRAVRTGGGAYINAAISFSMLVSASSPAPITTTAATTTTTTTAATSTTTTANPPPSGCALPAYPDATCTGVPVGTALTVVTGDQVISTANAVIDAQDIRGCVEVRAPGVTIKRSKISCAGFEAVGYFDTGGAVAAPLTIQDSTIDCQDGTGRTAVGDSNIVAERLNISGCENGFDLNQHIIVRDSFIHDLANSATAHTDGIQLAHYLDGSTEVNHSRDVTITHNRIYADAGTSAIISNPTGDVDITVQDNLLAGGAYTLYCDYNGVGSNYRVLNNHFSIRSYPTVGAFGPWTGCEDETQVTGNVYDDGPNAGQPVGF